MTRRAPTTRAGRLLAAALALTPGCATLITGTDQKVRFVTDPPGATVTLDNGAKVTTPGVLYVGRRTLHAAQITAPGRCPARYVLVRHVTPWVLGDVFTGILPGLVVDFLVGGAFALPDQVKVPLGPGATSGRCASAPSPSS